MKGYTEGLHGINGWSMAVGRGVLRTMICNGDYPCNAVQADIAVNALVVLAYERGLEKYFVIIYSFLAIHLHQRVKRTFFFFFRSTQPLYFNICEAIGKPQSWDSYLRNGIYSK